MDTLAWFSGGLLGGGSEAPLPIDQDMCRVTALLIDATGTPLIKYRVQVQMIDFPGVVQSRGIFKRKEVVTTDQLGYLEFFAFRGASYHIVFQRHEDAVYKVEIPSVDTINLIDLVFFELLSIEFEVEKTTLSIDESLSIIVNGLFTDGQTREVTRDVEINSATEILGESLTATIVPEEWSTANDDLLAESETITDLSVVLIRDTDYTVNYETGLVTFTVAPTAPIMSYRHSSITVNGTVSYPEVGNYVLFTTDGSYVRPSSISGGIFYTPLPDVDPAPEVFINVVS
ncbi:hypothetical protein LCGC14_0147560 [marine sediment metagenome]|uniref:Uncharacterized protein n=1 Tax=marine sediment metagenome TaxID=412755 RepID=A0A0F9V3S0_9ZZZZ